MNVSHLIAYSNPVLREKHLRDFLRFYLGDLQWKMNGNAQSWTYIRLSEHIQFTWCPKKTNTLSYLWFYICVNWKLSYHENKKKTKLFTALWKQTPYLLPYVVAIFIKPLFISKAWCIYSSYRPAIYDLTVSSTVFLANHWPPLACCDSGIYGGVWAGILVN